MKKEKKKCSYETVKEIFILVKDSLQVMASLSLICIHLEIFSSNEGQPQITIENDTGVYDMLQVWIWIWYMICNSYPDMICNWFAMFHSKLQFFTVCNASCIEYQKKLDWKHANSVFTSKRQTTSSPLSCTSWRKKRT